MNFDEDEAGDFSLMGSGGRSKLGSLFRPEQDQGDLSYQPKSKEEIMNPEAVAERKRQQQQSEQKFVAAGPVNVFAYPGGQSVPKGMNGLAIFPGKQGKNVKFE